MLELTGAKSMTYSSFILRTLNIFVAFPLQAILAYATTFRRMVFLMYECKESDCDRESEVHHLPPYCLMIAD